LTSQLINGSLTDHEQHTPVENAYSGSHETVVEVCKYISDVLV